jgi:signal transduction histidine kinase/DNA-binding response OmpR family regulator
MSANPSKRRQPLQRAASVRSGVEPPSVLALVSSYAERSPGTSIVDVALPLIMTFARCEHALAVRLAGSEPRPVACAGFSERVEKRLLSGRKGGVQRWISGLAARLEHSSHLLDTEPPTTVPDELPPLHSLYACKLASSVMLLLLSPTGLSSLNIELMEPALCVTEQLLREEQQHQSALVSLVQLSRALDRQGEALLYVSLRSLSIKQTSASATSLLGGEPVELVGKKLHRLFDKEKSSLKEFLTNNVQQPESPSLAEETEAKCWRVRGRELEVLVSYPGRATVKHSDCALLLLRKVDSYEKRVRDAEQKSKNKTEFMAHLGHEIRTPLNCILATVPLLASSSLSEEQKRCVQIVQQSSFDMMMIVGDFLDMARLDSNKMRLHESEISLGELLVLLQRSLRPSAEAKQLELTQHLDASVPAKVFADFSRLRQVLQNLVGNAIKFTRSGGSVHVSASAQHCADHHCISISVIDTGIGIAEENLKLIFKSFRQVDESTTQESGGTGLGLAISRKLVKLMDHGCITVSSQLGAGSTFTVQFNSPILDNELLLKRHSAVLKDKRVLVVDDISNNRITLFSQLEQWGLQPATAASAEDAINTNLGGRAEEPFDLGIIDLRMPMMDGVGLASWIRRRGFTFPLILLSSSPEESENLSAEERAIFKFSLVRPVPQRRMLAAVISALGAKDRTLELIINDRPQQASGTGRAGSVAAPERHRLSRLPAELRATRILVAEDTVLNQRVIQILLHRLGYSQIEMVDNGQAVLDACAQPSAHYDVILMDIRMPTMNGFEASKQLSNTYAQRRLTRPKVLALTAMASEEVLAWCAKGYLDDVLSKPIDINLLRDKLDRLLSDADQKRRLSTPL